MYRVLRDRIQLHDLPVTVNHINTIEPCAEGQESAGRSAGYCQSYYYNCTVSRRAHFNCMFCWLMSILTIKFYGVLKVRIQLHVLNVTVNPINVIIPCAEGKISAGCSVDY
jgi:hypothetical protein